MKTFSNIFDFQAAFNSEEKCREYLEQQRWNGTPACTFCGSINVHRFPNGKIFKCREKNCRQKFSVLVGSIYENTKLPLTKWFLATYILTVHSKGISSLQLANWLGVTQKTAWHLNHRIRAMLNNTKAELLDGIVEVDETYVGGKESNKHKSKRKVKAGTGGKTMVFGAVERDGKVITKVIPDTTAESLTNAVEENIQEGAIMVSDENAGYNGLKKKYKHVKVNHSAKEYVRGAAHTNTIEGFWSLLKRQLDGIHHSVSPQHLHRYCNEASYRYNRRTVPQDERFNEAVLRCNTRLTYKELQAKK
jgi:transposase-like protein/ribosomal protein L37AE/L43A